MHEVADGHQRCIALADDLLLLLLQLSNAGLHGLGLVLQLGGILLGLQEPSNTGQTRVKHRSNDSLTDSILDTA